MRSARAIRCTHGRLLALIFMIAASWACSDGGGNNVEVPCGGLCPAEACVFGTCMDDAQDTGPVEDAGDDVGDILDPEDVLEDVSEDTPEDEADPDVQEEEDVEDVGDEDVPAPVFEASSCLAEAIACHGLSPEPLSCTIRLDPDPLIVDARFGGGLRTRAVRPDSAYTVTAYDEQGVCFVMEGLSPGRNPDEVAILAGGSRFEVSFDDEVAQVTCADGETTESWPEAEVRGRLPAIFNFRDRPCEALNNPQCSLDTTCAIEDANSDCCLTAGTGRCMLDEACSDLPEAVLPFRSCVSDLLSCFGVDHRPLACTIDENTGQTELSYEGDRQAVVISDGFGRFEMAARANGGVCYTANFTDRRTYEALEVIDPDTGDRYAITFEGEQARVTCPDEREETLHRLEVVQHLPEIPAVRDGVCEVTPLEVCEGDESCGDERCCQTLEGQRCVGVDQCPEVEDDFRTSCLFPLFDCFGADPELAACVDFQDLARTEADYTHGGRAIFFTHNQQETLHTFFGEQPCFEAVVQEGGVTEVRDLVSDDRYRIVRRGNERVAIECPDATLENHREDEVLSHLPTRPGRNLCEAPIDRDECDVDADCEGEGQVCCDVGDGVRCLTEAGCAQFSPRVLCDTPDQCGEGEACCNIAPVRVCDPVACGGEETCCNLNSERACGSQDECRQVGDDCDLDDPESCQEGEACCQTTQGARCLVGECPDLEVLWLQSCLFDTFECFGETHELLECIHDSDLNLTDVTYADTSRTRYFERGGQQIRRTGFGETQCFEANDLGDGFGIVDANSQDSYRITFSGPLSIITCPDDTIEAVPTESIEPYLPDPPRLDQCAGSDRTWIESCLFPVFQCFGADRQLDACEAHGDIDIVEAGYDDDRRVTFYNHDGEPGRRTGFGQTPCFDALPLGDTGFSVLDLGTFESFNILFEGDDALITCPDDEVVEVPREIIEAYLPPLPEEGTCEAAQRDVACEGHSDCAEQDDRLRCCDVGTQDVCLLAEGCRANIPRTSCTRDSGCGNGEVCCQQPQARVCNPRFCEGDLCCNLSDANVCTTPAECLGIVDDCQFDAPESCPQDALCCQTLDGNRCVEGGQCPEAQEPLQRTCIFETMQCFGRDRGLDACIDYGDELGIQVGQYAGGGWAAFYEQSGRDALTTRFGEVDCYDAVEVDGGYEVRDRGTGDAYQVAVIGDSVRVTCPDESQQGASLESFLAFVPERPEPGDCAPHQRDDACRSDTTCLQQNEQLRCCDAGDQNLCLTQSSCLLNDPRRLCDDASACGDGELCCEVAPVRVCDPSVCGDQICCNLPAAQVCATEAQCQGAFDFCDQDNPRDCLQGEQCCETIEGTRCLGVDECPEPEDPVVDSCLGSTLSCFGRRAELASCIDHRDQDAIEASYTSGASATFFTRLGQLSVLTRVGEVGCYNAFDVEGGLAIEDLQGRGDFQITFEGDEALITCSDESQEVLPAGAVRAYLPLRPAPESCGLNDVECFEDTDCQGQDPQARCCDTGEGVACLSAEACFRNTPRPVCESDETCDEGQVCCELAPVRVCDPVVCGGDFCCNLESAQVCAEPEACEAIFDFCESDDPGSCGEGFLCCETAQGSRCLENIEACPAPQSPLQRTCLFDTLRCFGIHQDPDTCSVLPDLDVTEANYGDARATFFTHEGLETIRTAQGELPCYDAQLLLDDAGVLIENLATGESFEVAFSGEEAQILCSDLSAAVVARADLAPYLPTKPEGCDPGERNDACVDDAECAQLDPQLLCCDAGDGNTCLSAEGCFRNIPRQTCANDLDCGEDQVCCNPGPTRVCDPVLCGDALCCNVDEVLVCASPDTCRGVFDLCDEQGQDCGGDGELCCPTLGGTRCIATEVCPGVRDPIADTCLGDVLQCAGNDLTLDVCTDYGDLDVLEASYASGAATWFYEHLGRRARWARFDDVDCFEALERGEGLGFDITDLSGEGNVVYGVDLIEDSAFITCPDDTVEEVQRAALLTYLPLPPGEGDCVPSERNDECAEVGDCGQIDPDAQCCDSGDRTLCLPGDGCVQNTPRRSCDEDTDCIVEGEGCCELSPVRVCNPSLCDGELCCNVEAAQVCADGRTCQGLPDTCEVGGEGDCAEGTQCCETLRGRRCVRTEACPEIEDPLEESCLTETLACQGRDLQLEACLSLDRSDLIRANYDNGAQITFFRAAEGPARRSEVGNLPCFDLVETTDEVGRHFEIEDLLRGQTYSVTIVEDTATVSCPDDTEETVPLGALAPYLPLAPDPRLCNLEPAHGCDINADCNDPGLLCCDTGDKRQCLPPSACSQQQTRALCLDDEGCNEGEGCCEQAPTRICDPRVCQGQPCCSVEQAQVCATNAVCNGIQDHCATDFPETCLESQLCCPSPLGLRCVVGESCPAPENPLAGTCLFDTFECFGQDQVLDACVDNGPLGILQASYESGAHTAFYTLFGDSARRAGRGEVDCFELIESDEGFTVSDLVGGDRFDLVLDGDFVQIHCPDESVQVVTLSGLFSFLPPPPDPELCEAPELNLACEQDEECQQIDESLLCCDRGDGTQCLTPEGCFLNAPRIACASDDECGEEGRCCELSPVRVCNPSLCDGELCCNLNQAPVCAFGDECEAIVDFCDPNVQGACPQNALCCDTDQGTRCLELDECPVLQDPVLTSCIGNTLACSGNVFDLALCEDFDEAGVLQAFYQTEVSASFFERSGQSAIVTTFVGTPCFEGLDLANGGAVRDMQTGDIYSIALNGDDAIITCPDDTLEVLPRQDLEAYFPPRPDDLDCDPAQRPDECQVDEECQQLDPGLICCEEGDARRCRPVRDCAAQQVQTLCSEDAQCGEGLTCCGGRTARVCDPGLCDGDTCCTRSDLDTCDAIEGQCALEQSCLAETLSCSGPLGNALSCERFDNIDILRVTYDTEVVAAFYERLGSPALVTRDFGDNCFAAVQTLDPEGLAIEDLGTQEVYTLVAGEGAFEITCPDNSLEQVPQAAIAPFVPSPPDPNDCGLPDRNDLCTSDQDCIEAFGEGAVCCDAGDQSICAFDTECFFERPRSVCESSETCGDDEGCCTLDGFIRVCDPALCLFDVCCFLDSPQVCDPSCLQ